MRSQNKLVAFVSFEKWSSLTMVFVMILPLFILMSVAVIHPSYLSDNIATQSRSIC